MIHESLIDYQCLFFVGFNGYYGSQLDFEYEDCGIKIKKLPSHLEVFGSLLLEYQDEITELPEKLIVHGNFDIEGTNTTELPSNLEVAGNMWIRDTLIGNLPENIKVGRCLYVHGSVGHINGNIGRKHKGVNRIDSKA